MIFARSDFVSVCQFQFKEQEEPQEFRAHERFQKGRVQVAFAVIKKNVWPRFHHRRQQFFRCFRFVLQSPVDFREARESA